MHINVDIEIQYYLSAFMLNGANSKRKLHLVDEEGGKEEALAVRVHREDEGGCGGRGPWLTADLLLLLQSDTSCQRITAAHNPRPPQFGPTVYQR